MTEEGQIAQILNRLTTASRKIDWVRAFNIWSKYIHNIDVKASDQQTLRHLKTKTEELMVEAMLDATVTELYMQSKYIMDTYYQWVGIQTTPTRPIMNILEFIRGINSVQAYPQNTNAAKRQCIR